MKRIKSANMELTKFLADFIIFQCCYLMKESDVKEAKKLFENLARSPSQHDRLNLVVLLEAGTVHFSPPRFLGFFHSSLQTLEKESSQTVARYILKIKGKLIEIACSEESCIKLLIDLASGIRINFHDKPHLKNEASEMSNLIRE